MRRSLDLRPYQPTDAPACLAIFDSNTPKYFAPHERAEFAEFLERLTDPYFVVIAADGAVIGCGGYFVYPERPEAVLTWGMVANAEHGTGAGQFLLRGRLQQLCQGTEVEVVIINTSQHTAGFFAKVGFVVDRITPDGFSPGLDQYKMTLALRGWCATNGY